MKNTTKILFGIVNTLTLIIFLIFLFKSETEATPPEYIAITEEYTVEMSKQFQTEQQIDETTEYCTIFANETTEYITIEEITNSNISYIDPVVEQSSTELILQEEIDNLMVGTEQPYSTEILTETIIELSECATEEIKNITNIKDCPLLINKDITKITQKKDGQSYLYDNLFEISTDYVITDYQIINQIANENIEKYGSYRDELLLLINHYRVENGISELILNQEYIYYASYRATESAINDWNVTGYLNGIKKHIRPNLQVASSIVNCEYEYFAENYGRYQSCPSVILSEWQESSTHNKILLNENAYECGIGIAQDNEGSLYWILLLLIK